MNDTTVATIGMTLAFGLIIGALALPAGRWLGGGRNGKLAAFISVMLGAFTASLVLILLKIDVVDRTPSSNPYGLGADFKEDIGLLWLVLTLVSAFLYMLAYQKIIRRMLA